MKVLIACEYSGTVRDAFIAAGHEAMSCDLLPTDRPGPHYQGDIREVLYSNYSWDLMIAHPPCTYLCSSGLHWNNRRPEREKETYKALEFVAMLMNAPVPKIAIENPIGCISTRIFKHNRGGYCASLAKGIAQPMPPTQTIQPYQFGEDASKATCLWLFGLEPLQPTEIVQPRWVDGKRRWGNQTDSGQNNLPPSKDRWKIRSTTYQGIANAMANQWGGDQVIAQAVQRSLFTS